MDHKKRIKSVAELAGIIAVVLLFNACTSAGDATVDTTTTASQTTAESSELTEETTSEPRHSDPEVDNVELFYQHLDHLYESSNGELEGQMDYMVPVPDVEGEVSDPEFLYDASSFTDPDVSALALYYLDEGYDIYDPDWDLAYGLGVSDGEYQFFNGFRADRVIQTGSFENGDWTQYYSYVYVYKMNETLFDYYFVDNHAFFYTFYKPRDTFEDDGTVIRYYDSYDNVIVEYNRDTGIATMIVEFTDMSFSNHVANIESDPLREAVLYYADAGYDVYFIDPDEYHYFDLFYDKEYLFEDGFQAYEWQGDDCVLVAEIFVADEPMFIDLINNGAYGEELSREDDGTVIVLQMEDIYESDGDTYRHTATVEFNRDTGLITVTNENIESI